jgi:hypothetical protein
MINLRRSPEKERKNLIGVLVRSKTYRHDHQIGFVIGFDCDNDPIVYFLHEQEYYGCYYGELDLLPADNFREIQHS